MKKILVVDDEEKIRSIIRKYGEFEGYLLMVWMPSKRLKKIAITMSLLWML